MSNEILEFNDLKGLPRMYRNRIPIYPIMIQDALDFYECVPVLSIDKDTSNEVEILKMSYLKFLVVISSFQGNEIIREKLIKLLELCFRRKDIQIGFLPDEKVVIWLGDDEQLSEFDFKKIRNIIAEQNMYDLNDEFINAELKKQMDEARKLQSKKSGEMASFTQRILSYQYVTGYTLEYVLNMTLYQFNRSLENVSHIKYADLLQQAKYVGMKEFKNPDSLPTWLSAVNNDKYKDLTVSSEQLEGLTKTFE